MQLLDFVYIKGDGEAMAVKALRIKREKRLLRSVRLLHISSV
jgi:hypothetical protein